MPGSGSRRTSPGRTDSPTPQLAPIAGLVAFYNDRVDLVVDGELLAEEPDASLTR